MKKKLSRKNKKRCEALALEYGAKLTWLNNKKGQGAYGFYEPGTNRISVSKNAPEHVVLSIFCHELGHYQNFLNRKYWKYHSLTGPRYLKRFKTKKAVVEYALKAELYTDKVGRKLCKQLFPGVKYHTSYRYNKQWKDYFHQKYFGGYYIIIIG